MPMERHRRPTPRAAIAITAIATTITTITTLVPPTIITTAPTVRPYWETLSMNSNRSKHRSPTRALSSRRPTRRASAATCLRRTNRHRRHRITTSYRPSRTPRRFRHRSRALQRVRSSTPASTTNSRKVSS
uniref:(northern house mosquito) hypothetical protein n=1 Tax=Culex pipiens TaxID=7175 RepID=A0A8D8CWS9_CULPI